MKRYFTALYPYNATDFWSQGYGVISDALSSVTTESANSNGSISYQLEMTYPKNGPLASKLVEGNLIRCAESSDPNKFMIFEIVESNKADTGNLTIYGEAYPNRVRRMTFKNGGKFKTFNSPQEAINAGIGQIDGWPADFVVTCEVSGKLDFRDEQGNPTIFEDFGAFLDAINDAIHGEVEYTAWNRVRIYSKRGRDRKDEIQLRDDKNISGVTVKTDHSSIINVIVPLIPIKDAEGNPTAETKVGKVVKSAKPFEFINYYAGKVVQTGTQELADSYFNRTHADRPSVTVDVDPEVNEVDLASLQLFDTVTLYSKSLGYSTTIRVAQRDFDNLTGRVSHFSLGSSGSSIFTSSSSEIEQLKQQVTAAQNAGQVALVTADGKNQFFPESTDPPQNPREGDIWFKRDGDVVRLMQFRNGDWVKQVSDTTGKEIADALDKIADDAAKSKQKAIEAEEKAQKAVEGFEGLDENIKEAEAAANEAKSQAAQSVESSKKAASDAAIAINNAKDASDQAKKAFDEAHGVNESITTINTDIDSINGKLSLTASKESVDAVNKKYTTMETTVNSTVEALKLAAKKTEVDGLAQRVKTTESGLTAVNGELRTFAKQIDVNSLSGRVKTAESGIQANANEIKTKVTSSDVKGMLGSYATQTWTQTQIKQSADKINLSVASVSDKVDGMEIGGRNYAKDSNKEVFIGGPDSNGKAWSRYAVLPLYGIQEFSPNETLVVSTYVKDVINTDKISIGICLQNANDGYYTVNAKIVNGRAYGVIKVNPNQIKFTNIIIYSGAGNWNGSENKYITAYNYQLEKGTIPSDYHEAPEDTDSKIAALQIDANGIKQTVSNKADTSYVNQKAGSLTSTILNNKNDANKQFTTINQTLKGVQTVVKNAATKAELTTLSNVVSSKVSQSDLTKKVVKQNWVEDGSSRTSLYHGQKSATGKVVKSLAGPYTSIDFGASNLLSVKIGSLADADYIVELDIVSALSMNILVSDGPGGSGISGGKLSPNTTLHVKMFVPNLSLGTELIIMGDAGGKTFKVTNIKISERAKNEPIPPLVTFMGNIVSFPLRTSMKTKLVAGRQYTLEFDALSETTKNTALNLKTMKSNGKLSAVIKNFTPVEAGINPMHFKYTGTNWGTGWQDIILAEATTDVSKMNTFTVTNVYFYEGATQESTEQLITYSQYIQTQNALSLVVRKDDIVNRLNLSEEGLLIDAKKVQITGDTYIEKAAITSAMIKSLKADKITAGTIDASKINVINLNASRITTGTLTGVEIIQKTGERGTHLDYQGVGFYQNNTKVGRIATSEAKGYGGYYKVEYHAKNELTLAVDTEPSNRDGPPSIQLYSRGAAGSAVSISAGITMISGKANIGGMSVTPTQVDFGYTKIASGTDGLSFRPIKFNNINYPALSNYKKNDAGLLFGSSHLYLVVNGKVTDLAGVKLPTSIASDGTVNHWRLVG